MGERITILLADDHPHAREGMRTIISAMADFRIVGEADSGEEALAMTEELRPEIILMDINMPGIGGLEAVKMIKSTHPTVKIIIVTASDDISHLFEALKKGAQGFLLKNVQPAAWCEYIREVALDEAPLNPGLALSILREFSNHKQAPVAPKKGIESNKDGVTPREKEILQEVARGQTNREVAVSLGLSEHTVKNHLKNILQKLHLENRVQLTRYAYERGIVEQGDSVT